MPVTNQTTHQCIDWKKLDEWSREKSVDMMKPGWLIHPTRGIFKLFAKQREGALGV